jgi:hypothetical protein
MIAYSRRAVWSTGLQSNYTITMTSGQVLCQHWTMFKQWKDLHHLKMIRAYDAVEMQSEDN